MIPLEAFARLFLDEYTRALHGPLVADAEPACAVARIEAVDISIGITPDDILMRTYAADAAAVLAMSTPRNAVFHDFRAMKPGWIMVSNDRARLMARSRDFNAIPGLPAMPVISMEARFTTA